MSARYGQASVFSHNVVFLFFLSEDYVIYLVGECALGVFSERLTVLAARISDSEGSQRIFDACSLLYLVKYFAARDCASAPNTLAAA